MGIGEMGDDVCEKEASSPMDRAMKIAEGNVVEINTAINKLRSAANRMEGLIGDDEQDGSPTEDKGEDRMPSNL